MFQVSEHMWHKARQVASSRLQLRRPILIPLEATSYITMLVEWKFGMRYVLAVKKHDIAISTCCTVATLFRSRKDDEFALLVDGANERKCGFPFCGNDVEVASCVSHDI